MGEETFHPDTRALLAYGRALAGANARPKKGGADHVLERLFVIERKKDGRLPIRTFGAELVSLFGRDLGRCVGAFGTQFYVLAERAVPGSVDAVGGRQREARRTTARGG